MDLTTHPSIGRRVDQGICTEERMMHTEYIRWKGLTRQEQEAALQKAGQIIREGGLVAFPTETVYGLGADAMNKSASERIYAAKGRPSDNPLIVHISRIEQAYEAAREVSTEARKLMEAFWPGPLTVILPRKEAVPRATTGGLDTVAIRMPSHPVAGRLIDAAERLIAAPSANLSGRPSPTLGEHVLEDMDGRIPMIIDAGPVDIGIESTIVDMTGEKAMILRPGYVTKKMIEDLLGHEILVDRAIAGKRKPENVVAKAPGMKYRHYGPKGQMILVEGEEKEVQAKINSLVEQKQAEGRVVGVIAAKESVPFYHADLVAEAGGKQDPETVAASLYRILRQMDEYGCEIIYSESFFSEGMGNAVMNRMLKAAGYHLITLKER